MDSIELPAFDYPFPRVINPHAAEAAEATTDWAVRQGLLARDAAGARSREQYGWLAARAHPTASLEALVLVADFMSWLFSGRTTSSRTATTSSPSKRSSSTATRTTW